MREIKFRAWDKKKKKMIPHDKLFALDCSNEFPFLPLLKNWYSDDLDVVLMQYAELKDKNGKEIYEGDIAIANLKYFDIKNKKCKVIFKNGSFGLQYGYCADYFKSFLAWDDYEVIGNIYENPELLEAHHG